jgi:hypothetical protein
MWEDENPIEDIIETEFTDDDGALDLNLSVYQVRLVDVVRIFAEYNASAGNNLPTGKTNVDLAKGPGELVADGSNSVFALVASSHCELRFTEGATLRDFVGLVRREIATRGHKVSTGQLKTFVREQLAANDQAWVAHEKSEKSWGIKPLPAK